MKDFVTSFLGREEADLADSLLQSFEHSYTIESLNYLAESCNLELLYHSVNQFDASDNKPSWNLEYNNPEYEALDDIQRRQVGNLLMVEHSPESNFDDYCARRAELLSWEKSQRCSMEPVIA
jgi:hypothetical protein